MTGALGCNRASSGVWLALDAAGAAAFNERLDFFHGDPVEIAGDGVFQAACGGGEFKRLRR